MGGGLKFTDQEILCVDSTVTLVCDGSTDNIVAIQAAIEDRPPGAAKTVRLVGYGTGPAMISAAISLPSYTTLLVETNAPIKLADNCLTTGAPTWATNSDIVNGNTDIRILGGRWDGNVAHQTVTHTPTLVGGCGFRLINCSRVVISDVVCINPCTYALWLNGVTHFTVKNVIGQITTYHANQDGVHIAGPASMGLISNVQGNFNDDHVALTANDTGSTYLEGDITEVLVDGVFANAGYRGVRLMSGGNKIDNVSVRNVLGTYSVDGVLLSYGGGTPLFQRIAIDTVLGTFARKPIYIETNVTGPLQLTKVDRTIPLYINAGTTQKVVIDGTEFTNATNSTVFAHEVSPAKTVSALPAVANVAVGTTFFVTDLQTNAKGDVAVGGGTLKSLTTSDGSNWVVQ